MGVPDAMMGEKVGAVVVLEARRENSATAEICEFAEGPRLADFKVPQYMVIRPEPLPRNPGGKILKPRLRKETAWGNPLR